MNSACFSVKFIYSEKATKFCEIFTLLLSYVVPVKSKVKISQNCVAFSEYMNFTSSGELSKSPFDKSRPFTATTATYYYVGPSFGHSSIHP